MSNAAPAPYLDFGAAAPPALDPGTPHPQTLEALEKIEGVCNDIRGHIEGFRIDVARLRDRLNRSEGTPEAPPPQRNRTVQILERHTYRNLSTLVAVPTREMIHIRVWAAWDQLAQPANIAVGKLVVVKGEVGDARNQIVEHLLGPSGKDLKYLLFLDDDVLPPRDGWLKLARWTDHYKVVSGLYHTKALPPCPLMYRKGPAVKGVDACWAPIMPNTDWAPGSAVEVDGCGMGFCLLHREVFDHVSPPWFKTRAEILAESGDYIRGTEDLWFCEKLKAEWPGHPILVDTSIRCGHLDTRSGRIF